MADAENPRPTDSQPQQRDAYNSNTSSMTKRNAPLDALWEAGTRIEAAEAKIAKEREAARAEADRQRAAMEVETACLAEVALQKTSRIIGKRKRVAEADEGKLVSLRAYCSAISSCKPSMQRNQTNSADGILAHVVLTRG